MVSAVLPATDGKLLKDIESMANFHNKELELLNLNYKNYIKFLEQQIIDKDKAINIMKQKMNEMDKNYCNHLRVLRNKYNKEINTLKKYYDKDKSGTEISIESMLEEPHKESSNIIR